MCHCSKILIQDEDIKDVDDDDYIANGLNNSEDIVSLVITITKPFVVKL